MFAAARGNKNIVTVLLEKSAKVDSQNWIRRTPLSYAAYCAHTEIVKLLLEKGAAANSKDINKTATVLHAVKGSYEEVDDAIKELHGKDADINSKDIENRYPFLMLALWQG